MGQIRYLFPLENASFLSCPSGAEALFGAAVDCVGEPYRPLWPNYRRRRNTDIPMGPEVGLRFAPKVWVSTRPVGSSNRDPVRAAVLLDPDHNRILAFGYLPVTSTIMKVPGLAFGLPVVAGSSSAVGR